MSCYLKHREKDLYLKSYDGETGKVEFTKSQGEAKNYSNDWFANAEKSFLQFHFPDYNKEYLDYLIPYYT